MNYQITNHFINQYFFNNKKFKHKLIKILNTFKNNQKIEQNAYMKYFLLNFYASKFYTIKILINALVSEGDYINLNFFLNIYINYD